MTESSHNQAIERAIERLTAPQAGTLPGADLAHGDAVEAEYLAVLTLLPFADRPAVPDPALRASIFARIAGRGVEEQGAGLDTVSPPTSREPVLAPVVPLRRSGSMGAVPVLLAAMLGFCLVGLAFLASLVVEQRDEIRALASRIEAGESLAEQQAGYVTAILQQAERRLEMITQVAREAYPMRVVARAELAAGEESPRGVVWVCGRHQRWYLNVQGLKPAPPGQAYNMWFVTEDGLINAGILDVDPRRATELEAQFMPAGTHSFQVTLEPDARPHSEPHGSPILIADGSLRL